MLRVWTAVQYYSKLLQCLPSNHLNLICQHFHCGEWRFFEFKNEKNFISSQEIRKLFIEYFVKEKQHTYVHSSPVLPQNDPSLLFVNAGMNQFKPLFIGTAMPNHPHFSLKRAVNSQKCIRVGGKHNDLEEVGKDLYHHTFFEMLGSWSFGDYFKEEACKMAWTLLTEVYKLPKDNLYVTYFAGDSKLGLQADYECKDVWLHLGIKEDHIIPFGMEHNFWEMGPLGPCGSCTEIHYDHVGNSKNMPSALNRVNMSRPDLIELWNIVFIQYDRQQDGTLKSLSSNHIDTGLGFERLTAILQNTMSNYDTDLFIPLFNEIQMLTKLKSYEGKVGIQDFDGLDTAYRILADHARMFTVAIADKVFPEDHGSGHLLRKIIRKAAYVMKSSMKGNKGLIASLVPIVVESLGEAFPELSEDTQFIIDVVNEEEELYIHHSEKAVKIFKEIIFHVTNGVLTGEGAWELYSKHGMSAEIIEELCTEKGIRVEWDGFFKEHAKEQERSRLASTKGNYSQFSTDLLKSLETLHVPHSDDSFKYAYSENNNIYDFDSLNGRIVAVIQNNKLCDSVKAGERCMLILDKTNFYSEAGGQVADTGSISGKEFIFDVDDVHCVKGFVFHCGLVKEGCVSNGFEGKMIINKENRFHCMCNHTATHLLNAAIRQRRKNIFQRSSYVTPSELKFSFSSRASLTLKEVDDIEKVINMAIESDLEVTRKEMSVQEAFHHPDIVSVPGEVYPDPVTVVTIGQRKSLHSTLYSMEPCCGTHLKRTADIESFVITSQKSSSQAVRSVTALTGHHAQVATQKGQKLLQRVENLKKQLDVCMKFDSHADMPVLLRILRIIRTDLTDMVIPLRIRHDIESDLLSVEMQINNLIKVYQKTVVNKQFILLLKETIAQHLGKKYVILKTDFWGIGEKELLNQAYIHISNRPWMIFLVPSVGKIICHCRVPEDLVTLDFNAQNWIQPVAAILQATGGSGRKDPRTLFTVKGTDAHKLSEAMIVAKEFVENHL